MLNDLRYQIFLSSTYEDLREERQQATQTILEMGHMPAGMELFPASDLSQWELIKRVIDESDYYVVLVASRYGSVHAQTGLSFTEMEYDYAVAREIPVLGFVRRDIGSVPAKYAEADPVNKQNLLSFREKVLSKTCRQYENASELGLMVMKSLMTETRIRPRTGWVRANKARSSEDIERENSLNEEIKDLKDELTKAKRELRDRIVHVEGVEQEDLAQGDDALSVAVVFANAKKQLISKTIDLTWDEIFSVIGPQMYGYIVRRAPPKYNESIGSYPFEGGLVEYVRSRMYSETGARQIRLLPHEVDQILMQFKQLGYISYGEKEKEGGSVFRGFTLTEAGEAHLLKVKAITR